MSKIISVFNQKGGVGKTTTVINLSAGLGLLEKKILIIDSDPQGNCTSGLVKDSLNLKRFFYDVIVENCNIKDTIVSTTAKNVDIVPCNFNLAGIEIELAHHKSWQILLKKILNDIKDEYDFIFIDCPPSLGILSIMSLAASNSILIPIQSEYYALEGVRSLFNTYEKVKNTYNKDLSIEGVILSMYDNRNNLAIDVEIEVRKYFKEKVFETVIPRNVRLAEAPSHNLSIFDYDDKSKGADSYFELADEFCKRQGR